MRCYQDNYRIFAENDYLLFGISSTLGNRSEQQDSAGFELKSDDFLVVICDGMGGHAGGQRASRLATSVFLNSFSEQQSCRDPHAWLLDTAAEADYSVAELKDENEEPLMAGATVVSAFFRKQRLYWFSAGDSRIYLFRDGEMVQATIDHNYRMVLNKKLEHGEINEAELEAESWRGETLVSFLGINGLPILCSNETPFNLQSGDIVLLTTDGLYRLLTDDNIEGILQNFASIPDALSALEARASSRARNVIRDNMTVSIIKIK